MSFTTLGPVFTPQLLTSALIYVHDSRHNIIKCRALLNTCVTASFISESLVKWLGIRSTLQSVPISTINDTSSSFKGVVKIIIQSTHSSFRKDSTCLTLPAIADLVPSEVFPQDSIKIPLNMHLADPESHIPRPIDLLISVRHYRYFPSVK